MTKIAGIRFKPAGKIYDFDCGAFVVETGEKVIVETEQGLGLGTVAVLPVHVKRIATHRKLKKIVRIATENDLSNSKENTKFEKKAYDFCQGQIKNLQMQMNLFSVESTFDATKLTFFYTADGRIDFRQLVKNLVKEYRIRIEMRQVGVRNQSKQCGGIGRCGREICCSSFLNDFYPVSIRMAKEQGLSLNPTKISGLCGRLMCCLTFENHTYKGLKKELPRMGKMLNCPKGKEELSVKIRLKVLLSCVAKMELRLNWINQSAVNVLH